jgi:hypothetical protein
MNSSFGSIVRFTSNTTRKETMQERRDFANGRGSNLPTNYAELTPTEQAQAFALLASYTPDDTQRGPKGPAIKSRAW